MPTLGGAVDFGEHLRPVFDVWDRTLTVSRSPHHGIKISAGGVPEDQNADFAHRAVDLIGRSRQIHYLSLDADRSYPKMDVPSHQLGEAFERDWETTKKQSSTRPTRSLYEEWFRYLLGKANQERDSFIQSITLAREEGRPDPVFVDQQEGYRKAVRKVLPHLLFIGINSQAKEVRFDSTGMPLNFNQLSGGEREIAFLIGQIERFSLKKGLLLVDEPELHLNNDLLRSWIGYLKESVEEGQIWLATHSLEVVEVTGKDATFLLQRNDETRQVVAAVPISSQPIYLALSRAVGSPAFSISNLAFVFVEGEEAIGERERFRLLSENPTHVRFIEARSCKDVVRRVEDLRQTAKSAEQSIRVGGIIDSDWRSAGEKAELTKRGLFVLGVHEVENLFLHPTTLEELMRLNGRNPDDVQTAITTASDVRAGVWIFTAARVNRAFREEVEPSQRVRSLIHSLGWSDFNDPAKSCAEIAAAHGGMSSEIEKRFCETLEVQAKIYKKRRDSGLMWKTCEGKEVFRAIVNQLGYSDEDAAQRAILALWIRTPALLPEELLDMREYINAL